MHKNSRGESMKKISMQTVGNSSVDKAFLDFQRFNTSKNLSKETIRIYDSVYKYFRKFF